MAKNEFIKPNKKKIIWSIILFAFLIYLISTLLTFFYDVELPIFLDILYWGTLWPALAFTYLVNLINPQEAMHFWIIIIGGLILEAVYSYFLVCIIAWVSKKLTNQEKHRRRTKSS